MSEAKHKDPQSYTLRLESLLSPSYHMVSAQRSMLSMQGLTQESEPAGLQLPLLKHPLQEHDQNGCTRYAAMNCLLFAIQDCFKPSLKALVASKITTSIDITVFLSRPLTSTVPTVSISIPEQSILEVIHIKHDVNSALVAG